MFPLSRVAKQDEENPIKCVVVPMYGDMISVQETVNPGCKFSAFNIVFK